MKTPAYKDPRKPVATRVRDLLRRMTLEEKAAQLMQRTIGRDTNPNNVGPDHPFDPLVGSILFNIKNPKLIILKIIERKMLN